MRAHLRTALVAGVTLAVVAGLTALPGVVARPAAQKGGGGGGGRGGAPSMGGISHSRMDTLTIDFKLTKDQQKTIKGVLDDANKSAAPIRDGLTKTHAAIAAAIQGNKGQADIDAAVKSYAEQSTAMATLEMKALADVMKTLDAEQRANNAAISSAFFLMRSAFLDKKWDDVPDARNY